MSIEKINYCIPPIMQSYMRYFEKYWLSMTFIKNDDELDRVWEYLTLMTMKNGVIAVVKNIKDLTDGFTIAKIITPTLNKNNEIIGAVVSVNKIDNTTTNYYVYNFLFKDYKENLKKKYGTNEIYEAVFSKNNALGESYYLDVLPILSKICDLEIVGDRNRKIMNIIYSIVNGEKYTPEQLSNFGITISQDGLGASLTNLKNDNLPTENNIRSQFNSPKTIGSEWQNEMRFWIEQLHDIGGIKKERMSSDRENVLETQDRLFRLNIMENKFYKHREQFVKDYNSLFNKKAILKYGTSICKDENENENRKENEKNE